MPDGIQCAVGLKNEFLRSGVCRAPQCFDLVSGCRKILCDAVYFMSDPCCDIGTGHREALLPQFLLQVVIVCERSLLWGIG